MDLLTRVVAELESFRPTLYRDPVGKLTVGIGHLVKAGEFFDAPLSLEEGMALLEKDLAEHRRIVDALFHGMFLAPYEMDALTSFSFNVGSGNLEGSTLRKRLLAKDRVAAAREFVRWVWATPSDGTKVRLPGLVKRRDVESCWFLGAHPHTIGRRIGLPALAARSRQA